MANPEVSIIGSGNVATNLAVAMENSGIVINEIFSRNPVNAEKLTNRLYQAEVVDSIDFTESNSRLFILAVNDESIAAVSEQLLLPSDESILAHTSGSVALGELTITNGNTGVFYPLQTFTSEKIVDFSDVPLLIEGSSKKVDKILLNIAQTISNEVFLVDSESRETIHLAAVFAANFTTHLWQISQQILQEIELDLDILAPLIRESVEKSILLGPENSQTGPAKRNDLLVMNRHLKKLKDDPELAVIYKKLSEHIINKYH